jgi:hypothetical protein
MPNDQDPTPQQEAMASDRIPSRGRRRVLAGGLGAGSLLTLVSRPVFGTGNQCFSPSGFVSMPTSRHGKPQFCLGRTPGYWKQSQHFDEWPKPFYPTAKSGPGGHAATRFVDWFSPSPYPASLTFLQALEMGAGPPNDVTRHIVASILNVKRGWAPVLTVEMLKAIWHQYATTGSGIAGYYEPTAGVKWYHDEITAYFQSTMPL